MDLDALQFIAPHSILSYDLCLGPHVIRSRNALAIKQLTKNNFEQKTTGRYTKINQSVVDGWNVC